MAIKVFCEGCNKTHNVQDKMGGKRGKCPVCGHMMAVPVADVSPPVTPPRPKPLAPASNPATTATVANSLKKSAPTTAPISAIVKPQRRGLPLSWLIGGGVTATIAAGFLGWVAVSAFVSGVGRNAVADSNAVGQSTSAEVNATPLVETPVPGDVDSTKGQAVGTSPIAVPVQTTPAPSISKIVDSTATPHPKTPKNDAGERYDKRRIVSLPDIRVTALNRGHLFGEFAGWFLVHVEFPVKFDAKNEIRLSTKQFVLRTKAPGTDSFSCCGLIDPSLKVREAAGQFTLLPVGPNPYLEKKKTLYNEKVIGNGVGINGPYSVTAQEFVYHEAGFSYNEESDKLTVLGSDFEKVILNKKQIATPAQFQVDVVLAFPKLVTSSGVLELATITASAETSSTMSTDGSVKIIDNPDNIPIKASIVPLMDLSKLGDFRSGVNPKDPAFETDMFRESCRALVIEWTTKGGDAFAEKYRLPCIMGDKSHPGKLLGDNKYYPVPALAFGKMKNEFLPIVSVVEGGPGGTIRSGFIQNGGVLQMLWPIPNGSSSVSLEIPGHKPIRMELK